jgi:hypothetical protein
MFDKLTQEQKRGWQYELQQHNAGRIEFGSLSRSLAAVIPEGVEPQEHSSKSLMY